MGICCECAKKLRIFEGYIHPLRGRGYLVCNDCFEIINKSMEFYRKCLFEGRQNHKNECYFWDSENKKCKNEEYFKNMNKKEKNN